MILRLDNVLYRYNSHSSIGPFDLQVNAGDFLSVVGVSGSGKSTLLNLIAGHLKPASGTMTLNAQKVILVQQDPGLFAWRDVLGNVAFGLEMQGMGRSQRETLALETLALVGLAGFEKRRIHELSGGQKQRVALARALVLRPELLLLDEAFSALDPQTREVLGVELKTIWQQTGQTILFVTHDHNEAYKLAQKTLVLDDGKIQTVDSFSI